MSNIYKYIAILRKEDGTDYWVSIPDIPGCASSGKTEEEAMANFQKALDLHIDALRQENHPIPEPRSEDEVLENESFSFLKVYPVEVNLG
jgi:predicted RNase H-like HicB family nuclease